MVNVLVLLSLFVSVTSDIVPEFQFPCYVDVCTFPRQYCNSDRHERRCSPCTRSLCKEKGLPRACLYYCQVADQPKTTSPPLATAAVQTSQDKHEVYLTYMVVFIAATNTAIFVTIIFLVIWLVYRLRRRKPLSPLERFSSEGNGKQEQAETLLRDRRQECDPELELRRLDSWQSLPSYCYRDTKYVDVPERSIKTTGSTASEKNASASGKSQPSSQNISKTEIESQDSKTSAPATFISNPTGDRKSEYHEKPWKLGIDTEKMFDRLEPSLRPETDVEETSLKQ